MTAPTSAGRDPVPDCWAASTALSMEALHGWAHAATRIRDLRLSAFADNGDLAGVAEENCNSEIDTSICNGTACP